MSTQTNKEACCLKKVISPCLKEMRLFQIVVLCLCTFNSAISLLEPYLVGELVDSLQKPPTVSITIGGIMLMVILLYFLSNYIQNYFWFRMVFQGTAKVRERLFSILLKNPASFFEKFSIGDLTNRILNDSSMYAENKLILGPMIFLNGFTIVGVFAFLIYMDYRAAAIVAVLCVIYFCAYLSMNKNFRKSSVKEREEYSLVMNNAQETLSGIKTIRLFQEEDFFAARFGKTVDKHFRFLLHKQNWQSMGQSATGAITQLIPVVALLTCVYFIAKGEMTLGTAISFYTFLPALWEPIQNFTSVNLSVQMSKSVEKRLDDLLTNVSDNHVALPLPGQISQSEKFSSLSIENLHFAYQPENPIYSGLNLTINRGDRLAIIGPSGCGKSTLIQLLLGQLKPEKGRIVLNGTEIQNEGEGKLLSFAAMVPQDIFVFTGNVKENITFDHPNDEQRYTDIIDISMLSQIPNVDNAKDLSGGERQRVGLARAFFRDPELLILDEPTAALDVNLERELVNSLNNYLTLNQKSLIVISHRPEILRICNLILELKTNGEWSLKQGIKNILQES